MAPTATATQVEPKHLSTIAIELLDCMFEYQEKYIYYLSRTLRVIGQLGSLSRRKYCTYSCLVNLKRQESRNRPVTPQVLEPRHYRRRCNYLVHL